MPAMPFPALPRPALPCHLSVSPALLPLICTLHQHPPLLVPPLDAPSSALALTVHRSVAKVLRNDQLNLAALVKCTHVCLLF